MITKKMDSVIYCRVSSNEQNNDSQIFMCRKFCQEKGLKVLNVFTETGSARDIEKLDVLMNILYNYSNVNVIVYSIDRLCRNTIQGERLFRSLESKNINIISIVDTQLTSSFEKFSVNHEVWANGILYAQHESDLISQRVRRSVAFRKSKGDHIGNPCYGRKIVWVPEVKTKEYTKNLIDYNSSGPAPKCVLDIINSKNDTYVRPYTRKGCYNKRYLTYHTTESKVVRFIKRVTNKKLSARHFNECLADFQNSMGLLKRPVKFYKGLSDDADYQENDTNKYVFRFTEETPLGHTNVRYNPFIDENLVADLLNELNIQKRGKVWTGLKVKSVLFL
jgi:DNA invertase Pin-like site-specific DNA recombinase